jgi:transposase InsO family protein
MSAPNLVWCADFKGQFKTRDSLYCYPLTVTDGYSRYLLGCQALSSTAVAEAKPMFAHLLREFGLPERIRTDNGVPFATTTLARLSSLLEFPPFRGRFTAWDSSRALRWLRVQCWTYPPLVVDG